MRLQLLVGLALIATTTAACAASGTRNAGLAVEPEADGGTDGGGQALPEEPEGTPHALGTIMLGETRASATGDSTPIISVSFVPDAKLAKACTRSVGGCAIADAPKCMTGTAQGCATGESCTFDDACKPKCIKACTKACAAGEECFLSSTAPAADNGMACRKRDRFDGGALAFAGTTTALTLFPPYAVTPEGNGAPFLAKSEIRVQASGASKAGFEKFDEKFVSTTFLEANPPLYDLPRSEVFGSGALTLGWLPGEDKVTVTVSGPMGVAKCEAEDATGTYKLGRDVIREVLGTTTTAPSLTLSIARERHDVKKGKKTMGTLSGGQTVQPTGWIDLVTTSSETHSYTSCTTGLTMCAEQCVNTTSDSRNCGTCGNVCPTSYYCSASLCRL
jgi:hypothetical protein